MNTLRSRIRSILGLMGILLCVLGIAGVWYAKSRIGEVVTRVSETTRDSLARVNGHLVDIKQSVDGAKITVNGIREDLESRMTSAVKENISEQLQLENRVERLDSSLEKAGLLLNTSSAALDAICQTLELGKSLGLAVGADLLNPLQGILEDLQNDIQAAHQTLQSIGERLRHETSDVTAGLGREQTLKLIARLLATLGNFDKRLESLGDRLTEARNHIVELERIAHSRILLVTLPATLLLVWMGAGQVALWYSGTLE